MSAISSATATPDEISRSATPALSQVPSGLGKGTLDFETLQELLGVRDNGDDIWAQASDGSLINITEMLKGENPDYICHYEDRYQEMTPGVEEFINETQDSVYEPLPLEGYEPYPATQVQVLGTASESETDGEET